MANDDRHETKWILEKYGDLLSNNDKGAYYLSYLPEGTPISKNIFQLGFYYDGKYIKFRTSVWRACIPYQYPGVFIFVCVFLSLPLLYDLFLIKESSYIFPFVLVMPLPLLAILNIMEYALFPRFRIDCENQVFIKGHIFVKKLNFDEVKTITFGDPKSHGALLFGRADDPHYGPQIYLEGYDGINFISFVKFHIWECDLLIPICIDAIKAFIGKGVDVKQKISPKFILFCNRLVQLFALEILALLTSFFIIVVFFITFTYIADYYYSKTFHPQIGDDDLGYGFIVVSASLISFLCSIPLSVWSHIYILWKFFIRRKKHE